MPKDSSCARYRSTAILLVLCIPPYIIYTIQFLSSSVFSDAFFWFFDTSTPDASFSSFSNGRFLLCVYSKLTVSLFPE